MKKFAVQISRWQNGYMKDFYVDTVIEAETARKALEKVFEDYDLQGAPDRVATVFEDSETVFHGSTGEEVSYDVCELQ
jgi:hypothetical protein